jgi:nucleoid DNA-binding protein
MIAIQDYEDDEVNQVEETDDPQAKTETVKKARSKRARPYVEIITRHMADIAKDAGVSEEVAFRVSQAFLRKLVQRLMDDEWPEGGHLVLSNIGRFEWRQWAPRHGYNPRSKEPLIIPAQKKLRFVAARKFGDGEPLRALNATVAGITNSDIMPAAKRKKRRVIKESDVNNPALKDEACI